MLDKPQNPIMDTLKLRPGASLPPAIRLAQLPTELASLAFDPPTRVPTLSDSIWTEAIKGGRTRPEIFSWDALRPGYPARVPPNAFISEQEDGLIFAAARYYVKPRVHDPRVELKYVGQRELLSALKMTVLGISSPLHTWDPRSETFVQIVAQKGARGILLIDDKDEVVSASFIARFLTIGTLQRRLEILLTALRSRFAKEGPTIHAFTHALSTILSFLRESLARCPPHEDQVSVTLSAVWSEYEQYEEVLMSLAALCGRVCPTPPRDYLMPDPTPINLLSLLYDHLHTHLERQSPRKVTAIFAFILSSTSREYFQQLARSVGFGGTSSLRRKPAHVVGEQNDQYALEMDGSDDGEGEGLEDELDGIGDAFPAFFPPGVVDVLPAAQKSLFLLRAADPDHPLLRVPPVRCVVEWFWTWSEIEAAWDGRTTASTPPHPLASAGPPDASEEVSLEPALAQFRIFDMEPGKQLGHSLLDEKHTRTPTATLGAFLDAFPAELPPITPTLAHLTTLVFAPLVRHSAALSRALLARFLASAPSSLHFKPHAELLHAYLLLGSPAFKARLAGALFEDAEEYVAGSVRGVGLSIGSARRKASEKQKQKKERWPVGLSFALLERETWPPVGADLSFFLRTVIVDSFEIPWERLVEGGDDDLADGGAQEAFWVEAERRLGFAIRDLPTGPGHDQWLNPLCRLALDFLYMDYKAPHPLDILITPDILSKYQRMFTYLLRIMRVEHALGALFRMSRSTTRPLFPTLTPSNKLLLHLRFVAHSFVATLSEYVFDTAIGGNFDPFLVRLAPPPPFTPDSSNLNAPEFSDVFALAKAHSELLDDVLSACLLRSGQRGAGDLLRQALELVLELAILVGDLKTGRMEEYRAAPLLEELTGRFRGKMRALVKALKVLVDKGVSPEAEAGVPAQREGRKPTGGTRALAHLLESLSEWWSN
ncbi:gamma-tubulin complex, DGRIP91/SPC98 component protein [Mycena filopes]|nr:gamma-tubulin complex, DGRIP91/SPC98 component protein [Mycena filopes]